MPKKPGSRPPGSKAPARRRIPKWKPPMLNWRIFDPAAADTGGDDTLIAELVTYKKNLDLLLERKGEYVLIKGDEIVGYFPDEDSALEAGAERFDTEPALIKEIVEFEEIATFGGIY